MTNRLLMMNAIAFIGIVMPVTESRAATCSCSSVPLLGSMESTSPDANTWFFSSSYEFHDISDLYSGSDEVPDETGRDRQSRSLLLETSYGFNEKWSVTGLISRVEQKRQIGQGSTTTGSGLGDALLMVKYSPRKVGLFSRNGFSLGFGARIPVGDDDETDFVRLSEDLQPSTGAWSAVFWSQLSHSFSQSANTQIYAAASYSANGENDRDYRFGDEFTASIGASRKTGKRWGFSGDLRYRTTDRDERNSTEIPNTGGQWLDLVPAVQYHFNDNLAAKVSARIPVWRDLNDALQFTTSYAYSVSISYLLGGS
jgi:hypothetical protein